MSEKYDEIIAEFERKLLQNNTAYYNKAAKQDVKIMPVILALVVTPSKEIEAFPMPIPLELFGTGAGKDLITGRVVPEVIRASINRGFEILAIATITEAWMAAVPYEGKEKPSLEEVSKMGYRVSERADKEEVLMTVVETQTEARVKMQTIIREGKKVRLVERLHQGEVEGRFTDMLRKTLAKPNIKDPA